MKSDDIPADNAHLEEVENAKRAYQNDIELVVEGIGQMIEESDRELLFTNPLAFGQSMQDKVLDYILSKVEGEYSE